jgi:hypothetical protein
MVVPPNSMRTSSVKTTVIVVLSDRISVCMMLLAAAVFDHGALSGW